MKDGESERRTKVHARRGLKLSKLIKESLFIEGFLGLPPLTTKKPPKTENKPLVLQDKQEK